MRPTALVSTLADVVNAIVARFVAVGDARSASNLRGTALLIGKKYLPMSSNDAPPRIVFVLGDGDIGGVEGLGIGKGYVAGISEELTCYVWGDLKAPAWLPNMEYRSGINRANGGNVYRSVKSGASASSGGPTGSGQGIADGDAAWDFLAVAPPFDATADDIAQQLCTRLINCFGAVAPGRLTKAKMVRSVDPNVETYGQDYTISATYRWGVPRDRAIWAVPAAPISPPDPMRPEGDAGTTFTIDAATDGS